MNVDVIGPLVFFALTLIPGVVSFVLFVLVFVYWIHENNKKRSIIAGLILIVLMPFILAPLLSFIWLLTLGLVWLIVEATWFVLLVEVLALAGYLLWKFRDKVKTFFKKLLTWVKYAKP